MRHGQSPGMGPSSPGCAAPSAGLVPDADITIDVCLWEIGARIPLLGELVLRLRVYDVSITSK
jgi:hypothetical protein